MFLTCTMYHHNLLFNIEFTTQFYRICKEQIFPFFQKKKKKKEKEILEVLMKVGLNLPI